MAIVKSSLSGLEGVSASKVSLTEASVWYDPQKTTPQQIVAAISKSGYGAIIQDVRLVESNSIPQECLLFGWFC